MIKDWEEHSLNMDFSRINIDGKHPSDIDMFYLGRKIAIFGEIKNRRGCFTDKQRTLYERLVNQSKCNSIALFITHDVDVHQGGKIVDVSNCYVNQYYLKGFDGWITPTGATKVMDIFNYYREDL